MCINTIKALKFSSLFQIKFYVDDSSSTNKDGYLQEKKKDQMSLRE